MRYTPRRQNVRWLDGDCPKGVLAIYDNKGQSFDRYTIFYVPVERLEDNGGWIQYLGASEHPYAPQGFGQHGELRAYQVAEYRYRVRHQACTWSSLPADVKRAVREDLELTAAMVESGEF